MRFVGDVHGKTHQYGQKLDEQPSIQLGDMGLGFEGVHLTGLGKQHRFVRGNHDSPEACRAHPHYLGDFGYLPESKLFYISGAYSIDWQWRTPEVSWWFDEELSLPELHRALELFAETKPEIVASHECPSSAQRHLLGKLLIGFRPEKLVTTRTGRAMQAMLEAHRPKLWVFGHYHVDQEFELDGTKFICLNELSTLDISGIQDGAGQRGTE